MEKDNSSEGIQIAGYYSIVNFMLALNNLSSEKIIGEAFKDDLSLANHLNDKFIECNYNWPTLFSRIDNNCKRKIIDFVLSHTSVLSVDEIISEFLRA